MNRDVLKIVVLKTKPASIAYLRLVCKKWRDVISTMIERLKSITPEALLAFPCVSHVDIYNTANAVSIAAVFGDRIGQVRSMRIWSENVYLFALAPFNRVRKLRISCTQPMGWHIETFVRNARELEELRCTVHNKIRFEIHQGKLKNFDGFFYQQEVLVPTLLPHVETLEVLNVAIWNSAFGEDFFILLSKCVNLHTLVISLIKPLPVGWFAKYTKHISRIWVNSFNDEALARFAEERPNDTLHGPLKPNVLAFGKRVEKITSRIDDFETLESVRSFCPNVKELVVGRKLSFHFCQFWSVRRLSVIRPASDILSMFPLVTELFVEEPLAAGTLTTISRCLPDLEGLHLGADCTILAGGVSSYLAHWPTALPKLMEIIFDRRPEHDLPLLKKARPWINLLF